MPLFKRLYITDEIHECDCCGKVDIKATVALHHVPSGETVHFGPECAAQAEHPWAGLLAKFADFAPKGEGKPEDE